MRFDGARTGSAYSRAVTSTDDLISVAEHLGARLGVTGLEPFDGVEEEIAKRKRSGTSGGLGFTFTNPATSTHPEMSFPWASSLVVVAVPYLRSGDGPGDRSVARFADGDRYDDVRAVLAAVDDELRRAGHRTEIVYDDDRIIDRAAAVRSGVAWWGKSTMVLAPGFGPWFLIGTVVTDVELERTEAMRRTCGTCEACLPACPTNAIIAPGVLDARRCLAAILQTRGTIPLDIRPQVGGRVYGCDDCLAACPPGDTALHMHEYVEPTDPRRYLAMADSELERATSHWFVPGRQMRFVRRNALVAVGNAPNASDIHLLAAYASHPDELLAEHALWALQQMQTAESRQLADALDPGGSSE